MKRKHKRKRKILTVKRQPRKNIREKYSPRKFKYELQQPNPPATTPFVPTPYIKPRDISDTPPTGDYTFDVINNIDID